MFCRYCGNEIPEGGRFCSKCGKVHNEEIEPVMLERETDIGADPAMEKERDGLGGKILTFAILGLAFGISCLSFLGIIFAAMSKKYLKEYVERFGSTEGRASVGKGLGTAGLAVSISFTALWATYVLVIVRLVILSFF